MIAIVVGTRGLHDRVGGEDRDKKGHSDEGKSAIFCREHHAAFNKGKS